MIWPFSRGAGIRKDGGPVEALLRRASEAEDAGALAEAEDSYREALAQEPEHADASRRLAQVLALRAQSCQERGDLDAAIAGYEESLALDHGQGRVHNNLGNVYKSLGRPEEAMAAFRAAIGSEPSLAEAQLNLAIALGEAKQIDQAIEHCRAALRLRPDFAEASMTFGNLLEARGDQVGATECFRRAVEANPGYAEAQLNLGLVLGKAGDTRQAIAHCRRALELRPSFAEASLTLGCLLEQDGDPAGAKARYRDAIAARPDYAEAHFNHALQLLLLGQYGEGWREYEWRLRLPRELVGTWAHADRPRWEGAPLDGKTILLFAEQGFGDVIHFIRYVPLVAARGGRVVVSCPAKLKTLVESVRGVAEVVKADDPVPAFDVCSALMSLPRIFGTTLETIPAEVPYLWPAAEKIQRWKERLAADTAPLKVGLYWSTDTKNVLTPLRALSLDMLAPLGAVPGITFYSLQRGEAAAQAVRPPRGMRVVDLAGELGDFSDDAALMANLDLVVSINTATAHLAGALGRPVWTFAQFPPDWRWLLGCDDSPWYPTMRLFRKERGEDWAPVIERLGRALRERAAGAA